MIDIRFGFASFDHSIPLHTSLLLPFHRLTARPSMHHSASVNPLIYIALIWVDKHPHKATPYSPQPKPAPQDS